MTAANKPPWKLSNPKPNARRSKLSAEQKAAAKRRALKAGRSYPNLVDNMAAVERRKDETSRALIEPIGPK